MFWIPVPICAICTPMQKTPKNEPAAGFTIWFTGLSGSGKSTVAGELVRQLKERGRSVELLDGDEVRNHLSQGLGFSKIGRDANIRRIGWVAHVLSRNGIIAITAAISPYRNIRDENRRLIGRFVEVFVDCPLEACMKRDVKGLYKKALSGELPQFTGVSDPYEPPLEPEVRIETARETVKESADRIIARIEQLGYLRPADTENHGQTP